jgi:hypothetical protein
MAPLDPKFVSDDFFGLDDQKFADTCDALTASNAIIVIDAISLFHPDLRERLIQSGITDEKSVSTLTFSPVDPSAIHVNQLVEQMAQVALVRAFKRFKSDFDQRCEFGIGDLLAMQRWLYSRGKSAADSENNKRPRDSNRSEARKVGEQNGGIQGAINNLI